MSLPVRVREGRRGDIGFIVDAWKRNFAENGEGAKSHADDRHLGEEMARVFQAILPIATIRVACDPEDEDTLLGFAVLNASGTELHYMFVKQKFRRAGVAKALVDGQPIKSYTFATDHFRSRMKVKERGWCYTPRWTLVPQKGNY